MSFPRSTFLCTLLILSFCQLFAQKYLFDAELLTSEDGLANSSTSSVHKDKNGYLWIGTTGGLNRYDGYNFTVYTQKENGLYRNNSVHEIKEDDAGNLWLFYVTEKGHIPTSKDKFKAIDIFNPQTGKAIPFDLFFENKNPFSLNDLRSIRIVDAKNQVWLTTNTGELYLFKNGQFIKIYEQKNSAIQYVTVDNKDNIWLGSDKTITQINLDGVVQETQHLQERVLGIWTDDQEQLWWATGDWIATFRSGKLFGKLNFDYTTTIWSKKKGEAVFQFPLNKDDEVAKLDFKKNFFLHRSKEGYWYAQVAGQLNVFDKNRQFIYNYNDLLGKGKGFLASFGNYFEAANNELWLPTSLGLVKINISVNPFKLIQGKNRGTDCRGITETENGTILFLNRYLYQFNPKNPEPPEKKDFKGYFALIYTDSTVWSGVYTMKYVGTQFDLRTQEIYNYKNPDSLNLLLSFATLKETLSFDYLIGTNKGLHHLNLQQKKNPPFYPV